MTIIHWVCVSDTEHIELVDDFQYDDDGPIVPDEHFAWVDIYGIQHETNRGELPPLILYEGTLTHYYW